MSNAYLPGNLASAVCKEDELARAGGITSGQTKTTRSSGAPVNTSSGACNACRQLIYGEHVTALGGILHIDCFKCEKCSEKFAKTNNLRVIESNGKAYCETCYGQENGQPCGKCGVNVAGDSISAIGKTWHPKCFTCYGCDRPFTSPQLINRNGLPYCVPCGRN